MKPDDHERASPPRWFWLLPLLAIAAWWPIDCYWQSDDYLAMHYAQDLRRALADFAGPQYASTDIWLFYRPLVTLSFWFDLQIGGAGPFVAHLENVVVHGISTLLVALVWRRFLTEQAAFAAALLWALLPSHCGSIAWAVGRTDNHSTLFCLLSTWLLLRNVARRRRGETTATWPMLLAFAAALCCKEIAFVMPPIATLLACVCAEPAPLRARTAFAWRTTWTLWLLFAVYLAYRCAVLGRLGGYTVASYAPWSMVQGLGVIVVNLLVPWRWMESAPAWLPGPTTMWTWFAALPCLLAIGIWLRRPLRLLCVVILFGIACAPMAGFLADPGNLHILRYFYLPTVVLAGLLAGGGRLAAGLALLALLPPLVAMRQVQRAADVQSAAMHRALLREAGDGAPSPMFVSGLPHTNADGSAVQLHFGIDRMLEPPFGPGGVQLYALRPLAEVAGVVRLQPPDAIPFVLPEGSTWFFADATALGRVPAAVPQLPDLRIEGCDDGVLDVSTSRLFDLVKQAPDLFARRAPSFGLRTPGVKPFGYRVTIFTANGYLSCLCRDYGLAGPTDGWIDMLRFLAQDTTLGIQPAVTALQGSAWAGEALTVPTAMDRSTDFPVLVEAGALNAQQTEFVPTHRARQLLRFHFDRGYAGWTSAVQGR